MGMLHLIFNQVKDILCVLDNCKAMQMLTQETIILLVASTLGRLMWHAGPMATICHSILDMLALPCLYFPGLEDKMDDKLLHCYHRWIVNYAYTEKHGLRYQSVVT